MDIKRYEKRQDGFLTQNATCKDLDSSSCCIHNDSQKVLVFSRKVKVEESCYVYEQQVLFCPYCGYSYQPERSKREDSVWTCGATFLVDDCLCNTCTEMRCSELVGNYKRDK